tara:strand:+ start:61020 stop:61586 length:567 start_codon:yes stop_codon:yes gene_type:complete
MRKDLIANQGRKKNKPFTKAIMISLLAGFVLTLFSFVRVETKSETIHLFKVERSKDPDFLRYDVNVFANKLDVKNPLHIYWVKPTQHNKETPLTWIQRNYSYGIEYLKVSDTEAEFQFVSYHKRTFQIKKDDANVFRVFTKSGNKEVIVNSIYIQIDGGTFWFPQISRVELHCQNPNSLKEMVEVIKP